MIPLSKKTIEYLGNCSRINGGIYIREGNKISTSSRDKTIFSKSVVTEEFDQDFGIYDLDEFLSTLSLFDKPQLVLKETHMVIVDQVDEKLKIKYFYTDPSLIHYSDKDLKLPSSQISFNLTSETLDKINKSKGILKVDDMIITTENNRIVIKILNMDGGDSSNSLTMDIGENVDGGEFLVRIKLSNLLLLKGDYKVDILLITEGGRFMRGMSNFIHTSEDIEYFVAVEPKSYFNVGE